MGQLSFGKLKKIDAEKEYAAQMGAEALARQKRLADLEAGRCVCEPRALKRKWEGFEKATTRKVHDPSCPKFKTWMEEA